MARLVRNTKGQLGIEHNLPSDDELRRMFDAVPILEKYRVADQTIRAGIAPIVKQAKVLVPTGTDEDRDRRLDKQRYKSGHDWETHLKDTIKSVVRKGNNSNRGGAVGVAGPKWEGQKGAGQKIYLVASWEKNTRVRKLWGKDPKNLSKIARKRRNIMIDAANWSRPETLEAMKRKLRKLMDEIWKRQRP